MATPRDSTTSPADPGAAAAERQRPALPESNDNIRQRNRFVIEEQNIFNEGQVTPPTPSHQGNEGGVKPKGRSIIDQTEPNAEKE